MQSDGKKQASDANEWQGHEPQQRQGQQQQQQFQQQPRGRHQQDPAGTGEGASSAFERMKYQSESNARRQPAEDRGHDGAHS